MRDRCSVAHCNGIAIEDTDLWERILCNEHFVALGSPRHEPDWEKVISMMKNEPRVFDFRHIHHSHFPSHLDVISTDNCKATVETK